MAARKGSLIATAKAAKDQVAASKAAQEAQEVPMAGGVPAVAPQPTQEAAQEPAGMDWVTTAIHVPRDVLILLRRVAVERANLQGGRPSVSAVLVDLVRANAAALEKETGR